jgi:hypothetical protein
MEGWKVAGYKSPGSVLLRFQTGPLFAMSGPEHLAATLPNLVAALFLPQCCVA